MEALIRKVQIQHSCAPTNKNKQHNLELFLTVFSQSKRERKLTHLCVCESQQARHSGRHLRTTWTMFPPRSGTVGVFGVQSYQKQ